MSNVAVKTNSNQSEYITTLATEREILVDLTNLIADFRNDFLLGYYFTDKEEKIIAGKVIYRQTEASKRDRPWMKIPAEEIPTNAVTLSFFLD